MRLLTLSFVLLTTVAQAADVIALEFDGVAGGGFGLGHFLNPDGANPNGDLLDIDRGTGGTTVVGTGVADGLLNFVSAFDPAGNRLFVADGSQNLVVVDAVAGTTSASYSLGFNLIALEYDAGEDTLYGLRGGLGGGFGASADIGAIVDNEFLAIDPNSGSVTVLMGGLPGGIRNFASALDAAGDRFYYFDTSTSLRTIDTTTGAAILNVGTISGIYALEYDTVGGRLLALSGGGGGSFSIEITLGASSTNTLSTLDPNTGAATTIASGLPNGIDNFATAFDAAANQFLYQDASGQIVVLDSAGAVVSANNPGRMIFGIHAAASGTSPAMPTTTGSARIWLGALLFLLVGAIARTRK